LIIYLGLGSNMGDRLRHLKDALKAIEEQIDARLIAKSSIYETAPLYNTCQDKFLNQVIQIEADIEPEDLLTALKKIEKEAGRDTTAVRNSPRPLDLDILVFGDKMIDLANLQIPHPGLAERNFVLKPWTEISPELVIPGYDLSVKELLKNSSDYTEISLFKLDE